MELRNLTEGDLELYEAVYCDPALWEHLGGPRPLEGLEDKLRRDAAATAADEYWVLVIVPDADDGTPAGTVSIWPHDLGAGGTVNEMGWMVLPAFQGRGIGTAAVRAALERARSTGRWDVVHAYPPVTNGRSNAIARATGFAPVGELDYGEGDEVLRCNDWLIDLRAT